MIWHSVKREAEAAKDEDEEAEAYLKWDSILKKRNSSSAQSRNEKIDCARNCWKIMIWNGLKIEKKIPKALRKNFCEYGSKFALKCNQTTKTP